MLEAIPTGFISTNFQLEDNGQLVGEIDASMWREWAQLELDEGTYSLYRSKLASGAFVVERQGNVLARATKTSFWRCDFDVELGKRVVTLRRTTIWTGVFGVFDSDNQIGSVSPTSIFTRRADIIDLPTEWSVVDRAFLFWLCLIMWKRQS